MKDNRIENEIDEKISLYKQEIEELNEKIKLARIEDDKILETINTVSELKEESNKKIKALKLKNTIALITIYVLVFSIFAINCFASNMLTLNNFHFILLGCIIPTALNYQMYTIKLSKINKKFTSNYGENATYDGVLELLNERKNDNNKSKLGMEKIKGEYQLKLNELNNIKKYISSLKPEIKALNEIIDIDNFSIEDIGEAKNLKLNLNF